MFTFQNISTRLKDNKYSNKQKIFAKIALEIYKLYEIELKNSNKIDFNDMINLAVEIINNNQNYYQMKYDHILIDEFQDISFQRLELIKGFVNKNSKVKLFCVGDDWQSIYQFNGSNVEYIVNMQEYFPNPELSFLNTNYRSTKDIVELSNQLIKNNKKQIQKTIVSTKLDSVKPELFVLSEKYSSIEKRQIAHICNKVKNILKTGVNPHDILIISRFQKV